ncbi:MAG: DUF3253 domain-containing protein [Bosea sp.]|uniref:DUF3253 domain-containing protein n=1 Tax=unclassified Bosea (in: a-proteobacteria) TaxID=2653178 RepID=UPI00096A2032|nr:MULTISPECIES: DUF3253 domain-containing protein [unclassified Bosea (in: a-proteobacteria)]MBN9456998.1 DUF3253 domain-containing protein [Bosea sp. (in: a-proteobacteria)]OJV09966.1 MAG: hypothetical protein BGO20_04805 [Bosea sp. 67-29]
MTTGPAELETAILDLLAGQERGRTISPMDVARVLGGDHPDGWRPLMQPLRRAAVKLMKEGRLVITRKGRPVDPDDFRGVYRLSLPG